MGQIEHDNTSVIDESCPLEILVIKIVKRKNVTGKVRKSVLY